jgi:hypothetical protein
MPAITGPNIIAPDPRLCMLGRGIIYFDQFLANSTTRTGIQDLGNCTTLEVEPKVEIKEKYESRDPASSLYARAVTRETFGIKITGDEYSVDNLVRALLGSGMTLAAATGGTVTDEAITPSGGAILGRYYDLAHRNITTLTNVKQGATTLVLGTDYTVDLVRGRIYLLPTSVTITPASALTASYVWAAYTYSGIAIGTVGTIEGYLNYRGNPVKGPQFEGEWWHVSFTPSGALGFIADDFGNWTLEGLVIADPVNHPTEPIGHLIAVG